MKKAAVGFWLLAFGSWLLATDETLLVCKTPAHQHDTFFTFVILSNAEGEVRLRRSRRIPRMSAPHTDSGSSLPDFPRYHFGDNLSKRTP